MMLRDFFLMPDMPVNQIIILLIIIFGNCQLLKDGCPDHRSIVRVYLSELLPVFLYTVQATMIKGQEEQCKTKINKICDYYNSSEIKKDLKTEKDFKKDLILPV